MKKYNAKFLFMQIGSILLISSIVGIYLGKNSASPVLTSIVLTLFIAFAISVFYFALFGSIITDEIAMKTEKKYSAERGYSNSETFYSSSEILKVNVKNGKIAYIANQNPLQFQEINAADLTEIKTGYFPGPLGGTSYVYFEFRYQGKKRRITTFKSNQAYSLKSEEVKEAMSKADYFCEIINKAKKSA